MKKAILLLVTITSLSSSVQAQVFGATAYAVNASCSGVCDGMGIVVATGGTTPYSYMWNDPGTQSTDTAFGLCAATYTVIARDAGGTNIPITITVGQPTGLVISGITTPEICGQADGSCTTVVNGGTQPYTYLWSSGQTTPSITNLVGGNYTLQVTDSSGCAESLALTVGSTPALTISTTYNDPSTCGVTDGFATVTVFTGTPNYTYAWDDPFT